MAKFIVRVTLHEIKDLDHENYATLHEEMEKALFLKKIKSKTGVWYHLPPAEYFIEKNDTLDKIYDKVKSILDSINLNYGFIVFKHEKAKWCGLKRV